MSVYKKLQEARVRFHGKSLKKSGENKFAGYKYFELGDFLPTVQQIFHEVGLAGVISFSPESSYIVLDATMPGGQRVVNTQASACLTVVDVDKPDERIVFNSPSAEVVLKGCLPIQGIGAAQTYLRRYLWVTALEIVENDLLDASTGSGNIGMIEAEVSDWIGKVKAAADKEAAKVVYQAAAKACKAAGDTDAQAKIKAELVAKWA